METESYLVFSLKDELFAIAASAVREMFWLPELTSVEEAPSYIAGVLNLRKKIIPVTDLNMLLGHDCRRYNLSDSIIVIENAESFSSAECGVRSAEYKMRSTNHEIRDTLHDERLLGLIVNEVRDVIDISSEDIEPSPFSSDSALTNSRRAYAPTVGLSGTQHSALEKPRHHFIDSEARVGEDIIMILNHNKVFDAGFQIEESKFEERDTLHETRSFCPEAAAEERQIFHDRAVNLIRAAVEEGTAGLLPMAVIGLGSEYYGIDLELVREFSDIPDLTPIPCCPEHILGNMNLRGNVLTVIDIRDSLNLPFSAGKPAKVIVAGTGELSAGIAVDNVYDVIYLNPSNISTVPTAVRTNTEQYIKGTAPYNSSVMTIIDLKKILEREELVVNEEV